MTEEQMAINRLKCGNTAHSKNADYIQLAIKALEKQIPKKPVMIYYEIYDDEMLCCPNCKDVLTDRIPMENKDFYFYCYNCGQKLDWSE